MKNLTEAGKTAGAIRKELKTLFPDTTFSVRSKNFAGGDSVHIDWKNGVNSEEVQKTVNKYEYGSFDGMQDLYEFTNCRTDIPQVKYVLCQRTVTDEIYNKAYSMLKSIYANLENTTSLDDFIPDFGSVRNFIWKSLRKLNLNNPLTVEILRDNWNI